MRRNLLITTLAITALTLSAGCSRHVRRAQDITPGNFPERQLDWRYGANDIRIQTSKLGRELMDRWYSRTGYRADEGSELPRIIITAIDNRTDMYISTDLIRDIFEGVAVSDGRYTIVVGDTHDERELDQLMQKISNNSKYSTSSKPRPHQASAPQFLAQIRLTKASNEMRTATIEDYRMTINLYDIETQELVDSAWDVLRKRVER